jgi:hypothetical protein
MIELHEWIRAAAFDDKPWLMLGKGPSFSRRSEFPLTDYNLIGLNNVVAEQAVDIAHIIDVDVVGRVEDRLAENCKVLIMARRPHVDFKPSERLLEDYFDEHPVLRQLDDEGRLVWYNATTSGPVGDAASIKVRYFSSEAALRVLVAMGVRKVRTLGIDGGTQYGKEFEGLPQLRNGLPSFDAQFRELEEVVAESGIDYDPIIEPMRIFCGLDESQIVAARVLEYSIRKHATRPVRFYPMLDVPTPVPRDPKNRGRTGFSFARFHIPQLSGYKGRGLYVDADMQVFRDISELWDIPFDGAKVMCTFQADRPDQWKDAAYFHPGRQMSVMMLDCERLDWDINDIVGGLDEGRYSYEDLMFELCVVDESEISDALPPRWNHLEHYEPGETSLLHYTVVPTQPWKNDANPLRDIWHPDFEEARRAQLVHEDEIVRLARAGHIKRSLAGLPPVGPVRQKLDLARAKAKEGLIRVERRYDIFRRPAVLRLRDRIGL